MQMNITHLFADSQTVFQFELGVVHHEIIDFGEWPGIRVANYEMYSAIFGRVHLL